LQDSNCSRWNHRPQPRVLLRRHGLSSRRGKSAYLQPHHAWLEVCSWHICCRNPASVMYLCLSPCDPSPSRPVEIKRSAPPPRPSGGGGGGGGKSVFVSNLPTDAGIVSCDLLRDAFGHCGTIANVVSSRPPQRTPRAATPRAAQCINLFVSPKRAHTPPAPARARRRFPARFGAGAAAARERNRGERNYVTD
jgi:hypothetical protein